MKSCSSAESANRQDGNLDSSSNKRQEKGKEKNRGATRRSQLKRELSLHAVLPQGVEGESMLKEMNSLRLLLRLNSMSDVCTALIGLVAVVHCRYLDPRETGALIGSKCEESKNLLFTLNTKGFRTEKLKFVVDRILVDVVHDFHEVHERSKSETTMAIMKEGLKLLRVCSYQNVSRVREFLKGFVEKW